MSEPDDIRPVSVAELLARNGTIGSPPVGGHRRRKRRDGVSVAELTGEIPVYRTGEIPVVSGDEIAYEEAAYEEAAYEGGVYQGGVYEGGVYEEASYQSYGEPYEDTGVVYAEAVSSAAGDDTYSDHAYAESVSYEAEPVSYEAEPVSYEAESVSYVESVGYEAEPMNYVESASDEAVAVSDQPATYEEAATSTSVAAIDEVSYSGLSIVPAAEAETSPSLHQEVHPLSSNPMPSRGSASSHAPVRGYDPRPLRRSSGAEQMTYDPVDQSVDLAELVEEHGGEELRSYLRASSGTLFSGGTVADDLARRGLAADSGEYAEYHDYDDEAADQGDYAGHEYEAQYDAQYDAGYAAHDYGDDAGAVVAPAAGQPRSAANKVWNVLVAVAQSLLAVAFGAGLFIAFDQLWRWNHLVALVMTVLVVLALAAGVRVVRRTEDIVSTLTAVAVGLLVTLGPLALQST